MEMGIPDDFTLGEGSSRRAWQERLEGEGVARRSDGLRVRVTRTIHGNKRFAEDRLAELLTEVGRSDQVANDWALTDLVQKWRPIAERNL
jgi:hypothetical protein